MLIRGQTPVSLYSENYQVTHNYCGEDFICIKTIQTYRQKNPLGRRLIREIVKRRGKVKERPSDPWVGSKTFQMILVLLTFSGRTYLIGLFFRKDVRGKGTCIWVHRHYGVSSLLGVVHYRTQSFPSGMWSWSSYTPKKKKLFKLRTRGRTWMTQSLIPLLFLTYHSVRHVFDP